MGLLTDYLKTVPLAELLGPKFAQFEEEFARLKLENLELQAKLRSAETEIRQLKNLPRDLTPVPGELPNTLERILLYLSSVDGATADALGRQIRQGPEKTRLKLAELQKSGFVWQKGFHDREPEWRIAQNGRKYLADKQLAA